MLMFAKVNQIFIKEITCLGEKLELFRTNDVLTWCKWSFFGFFFFFKSSPIINKSENQTLTQHSQSNYSALQHLEITQIFPAFDI